MFLGRVIFLSRAIASTEAFSPGVITLIVRLLNKNHLLSAVKSSPYGHSMSDKLLNNIKRKTEEGEK